ncbi:MAG TPA: hypothetical protein VN873_11110 [Candidatus Angelobacter sp.]|nr:hypothetical protein [Candidatus Angelobacter sp.]
MEESTKITVEKYQAKLAALDAQSRKIKIAINGLYELEDEEVPYPDVDNASQDATARPMTIRPDQFFGRPLATVVREILGVRSQRQLGAIALDELFALMLSGGFDFEGKDETTKKRTLAITLAKNPAFVRVPSSGHIGLAEWYPNAKKKPAATSTSPNVAPEVDGDEQEIGTAQVQENHKARLEQLAAEEAAGRGE